MVSAGMPELMQEHEVQYLVKKLNLHLDNKQVKDKILKQINDSLKDKYRLVDNWIHYNKHLKK